MTSRENWMLQRWRSSRSPHPQHHSCAQIALMWIIRTIELWSLQAALNASYPDEHAFRSGNLMPGSSGSSAAVGACSRGSPTSVDL